MLTFVRHQYSVTDITYRLRLCDGLSPLLGCTHSAIALDIRVGAMQMLFKRR